MLKNDFFTLLIFAILDFCIMILELGLLGCEKRGEGFRLMFCVYISKPFFILNSTFYIGAASNFSDFSGKSKANELSIKIRSLSISLIIAALQFQNRAVELRIFSG